MQNQDLPSLLIDGPNIDGVLGELLRRKPRSDERPHWGRMREGLVRRYGLLSAEFVANGNSDQHRFWGLYRYLHSQRFDVRRPKVAEHGMDPKGDPVDDFILWRIDHVRRVNRSSKPPIILASHDGGYAQLLGECLSCGFPVTIIGIEEWLAPSLLSLTQRGTDFLDIEFDLGLFRQRLERPWKLEMSACA